MMLLASAAGWFEGGPVAAAQMEEAVRAYKDMLDRAPDPPIGAA